MSSVHLRDHHAAASPLAVIVTVVLVAIGLTSLAWFLLADDGAVMEVQLIEEDGVKSFQVTRVGQSMDWGDLDVRFVTPSGSDQAGVYLTLPDPGDPVRPGDAITFQRTPPAGTYLLQVFEGGEERVRLSVPL